jgi:hypothetical protein
VPHVVDGRQVRGCGLCWRRRARCRSGGCRARTRWRFLRWGALPVFQPPASPLLLGELLTGRRGADADGRTDGRTDGGTGGGPRGRGCRLRGRAGAAAAGGSGGRLRLHWWRRTGGGGRPRDR